MLFTIVKQAYDNWWNCYGSFQALYGSCIMWILRSVLTVMSQDLGDLNMENVVLPSLGYSFACMAPGYWDDFMKYISSKLVLLWDDNPLPVEYTSTDTCHGCSFWTKRSSPLTQPWTWEPSFPVSNPTLTNTVFYPRSIRSAVRSWFSLPSMQATSCNPPFLKIYRCTCYF